MKNLQHILVFLVLLIASLAIAKFPAIHFVAYVIIGLFLFHLIFRKSRLFKSYFLSSWNIFTSKYRHETEVDMSKDLLLSKVVEGLESAKLQVHHVDEAKGEVFATSGISWLSWGENVYVSITERNGKSVLNLCSVGFFQMYSWGKNQANYDRFISEFEKSLII